MDKHPPDLFEDLRRWIESLPGEFQSISEERKIILSRLSEFIIERSLSGNLVKLMFICTHNSRRSQLGQAWARVAAYCYGIPNIQINSGGTERTAFHPNAVGALKAAGIRFEANEDAANPVYSAMIGADIPGLQMYSKIYNEAPNPVSDFAAIMVCAEADEACPFILGARQRISLPFEDPKASDGSLAEKETYAECARLIACEVFYAFSLIGKR